MCSSTQYLFPSAWAMPLAMRISICISLSDVGCWQNILDGQPDWFKQLNKYMLCTAWAILLSMRIFTIISLIDVFTCSIFMPISRSHMVSLTNICAHQPKQCRLPTEYSCLSA
jgi:hypothetical protein